MPIRKSGSPRAVAAKVLQDAESGRRLSEQLDGYLRLFPAERTLVTMLVYGVQRHRERLDLHINTHAGRRKNVRGTIRQLLRIATFELLELRRPLDVVLTEAKAALPVEWGPIADVLLEAIGRDDVADDPA